MVMARELSAIFGLQMRAPWSSYRTAIYRSEDLTKTSVMVQHYVCKTVRVTPWVNVETRAAGCTLILCLQVSANQFPTAIEIPMIPHDISTSAARLPLEISIVHCPATVEP
jgi:hypothetical protein